jgi:putative two-component system response regulator
MRDLTSAKILIVDDQVANVRVLERMLAQAAFDAVTSTTDPQQAIQLFQELGPDLVLLDLHMPGIDGFEVMRRLQPMIGEGSYVPILVLTADASDAVKKDALAAGAKDFLTKPFDLTEVLLRIRNLLETRLLYRRLEDANQGLEEKVSRRTVQLQDARNETLERLALAAERRDDDTGEHIRRVGALSAHVAQALELSGAEVELIGRAAPLHDVGKIGIPDGILLKPGKYTPEEFDHMKTHSAIGAHILGGSSDPVLQMAEVIALCHHERWDGTGYPRGLRGEEIPLSGRIVAVADVFDALTHERPYKKAWPVEQAVEEIEQQSERHFDPRIVEAFLTVREGLSGIEPASWSASVRSTGRGLAPAPNRLRR